MNAAVGAPLKVLLGKLKPRNDDDFVDRLFYIRTPSILFTFALIIGAKQLVGQPIQCWAPKEFKRDWMQYAEGFCFVENTYYVATDEHFPILAVEREDREIHYYQWVPFVLIGQALLLMAPKLLWNAFNWKNGLDIRSLIKRAEDLTGDGEFEGRERAGRELGDRIGQTIEQSQRKQLKQEYGGAGNGKCVPEYGNYGGDGPFPSVNFVTGCYLLFKLVNVCMVLFQMHLLTKFLGHANDSGGYWGWSVITDLIAGRNWRQSGAFPRETFCDFDVRQPSAHQKPIRYTLQCVLMINMFNEKIFLFLWFWLAALIAVGLLNFLIWLHRSLSWSSQQQFVLLQMRFATPNQPSANELRHFVRHGLCRDGVTALRLIALNCEPTLCALLVQQLLARFRHVARVTEMKMQKEALAKQQQRRQQMMINGNNMNQYCNGIGSGNVNIGGGGNNTFQFPAAVEPQLFQQQCRERRPSQLNGVTPTTGFCADETTNANNNIAVVPIHQEEATTTTTTGTATTSSAMAVEVNHLEHNIINIEDLAQTLMKGAQPERQHEEEMEHQQQRQAETAIITSTNADNSALIAAQQQQRPFVVDRMMMMATNAIRRQQCANEEAVCA